MKKKVQSLWLAGVLVLLVGTGLSLNAQQTPQTQPQEEQTQQPAQPNQPAQQNQPAPPNQTQTRIGSSKMQTLRLSRARRSTFRTSRVRS